MDKDSKGQRKMEESGGGLLPAVEGHSLEQNRIEQVFCLHVHQVVPGLPVPLALGNALHGRLGEAVALRCVAATLASFSPSQHGLFVGCLFAYRPSNMPVYLRDGSAQTI